MVVRFTFDFLFITIQAVAEAAGAAAQKEVGADDAEVLAMSTALEGGVVEVGISSATTDDF